MGKVEEKSSTTFSFSLSPGFLSFFKGEEEEITSFQPHQAVLTTYKQESVELVYLTLGTTGG
jgi:hypothetical protein